MRLTESLGTQDRRLAIAFSEWSRDRYRWNVPAGHVRLLADVIAGLEVAIRHFSTPDSAVIVPTPAYMPFLTVPVALGRDVIQVPMSVQDGRYVHDLEALDRAFEAGGNLLVLCNPHNPIGRVRPDLTTAKRVCTVESTGMPTNISNPPGASKGGSEGMISR